VAPLAGFPATKMITVLGTQIQKLKTFDLNFGPPQIGELTWPHASVATLVSMSPQPFQVEWRRN